MVYPTINDSYLKFNQLNKKFNCEHIKYLKKFNISDADKVEVKYYVICFK